jgi:primosomal replication protein N
VGGADTVHVLRQAPAEVQHCQGLLAHGGDSNLRPSRQRETTVF